jgi:hypothetical protein
VDGAAGSSAAILEFIAQRLIAPLA